jgi:ATP:corrinoid adenosyltransferase
LTRPLLLAAPLGYIAPNDVNAVQRRRRPSAGVVVGRHAIGILVDVDQITAIKLVKHGIRWSARPVENV